QVRGEPGGGVGDLDVVAGVGRRILSGEGEAGGVAEEVRGQVLGEVAVEPRPVAAGIAVSQEELEARSPVVVAGAGGVEPKHFGAGAQEGRGVGCFGYRLLQ